MSGTHREATGSRDGGDRAAGGATPMVREDLTLAQVLELVGYGPDELLSVLVIRPGSATPEPVTGLKRPADLVALAQGLEGANLWHSLSTFRPGTTGRGKASDVARIPGLGADLDVVQAAPHLKERGVPTWALAWELIEDLSEIMGSRPLYVTMTGHGLQPFWGIDPEESTDVLTLGPVLKRFGVLARHVARVRGCALDSVFDTARVWRASGSWNLKDPAHPVQAQAWATGGAPLGLAELLETFEEYNVPSVIEDTPAEPVTVDRWEFAERSCPYVLGMIEGWGKDTPSQKHPWLVSGAVRLAAAYRAGCVSEAAYHGGIAELEDRMRVLCAVDPMATGQERRAQEERALRVRDEIRNPLHGAVSWALTRVEAMSEERLSAQLGKCHRERLQVFEYTEGLKARGGVA